jgi:hypothetical protein
MAPSQSKKAKTDDTALAGHIKDRDSLIESDDSTDRDPIIPDDKPENSASEDEVEPLENDVEVQPTPPPVVGKRKRGPKSKKTADSEGTTEDLASFTIYLGAHCCQMFTARKRLVISSPCCL